jgi:hypothetical protein
MKIFRACLLGLAFLVPSAALAGVSRMDCCPYGPGCDCDSCPFCAH